MDAIGELKLSGSPGPDGLPPSIVCKLRESLYVLLLVLFNRFLSEGCFPDLWKLTNVVPVFKKGVRDRVENYRIMSSRSYLTRS